MEATSISKAQRLSLDRISTLPQVIIETILCLLPIEEAARTSILSREWRYRWTKIPKLVLRQSKVQTSTIEGMTPHYPDLDEKRLARIKFLDVVHQVLLLHQGPLLEFSLLIDDANCRCVGCSCTDYENCNCSRSCTELDQITPLLSSNHTLKKLTLEFGDGGYGFFKSFDLSLTLFSLPHLTDLYVKYGDVKVEPIFHGFGNLTSLTLDITSISTEALLRFLSNCPSFKRLWLMHQFSDKKGICIMELFKCLPMIEHLIINIDLDQLLVPKELTTSLVHLKYFCINLWYYDSGSELTFLGVLIKCSPNLEKIKLEFAKENMYDGFNSAKLEEYSAVLENYSDAWMGHLKELEIGYFRNFEPVVMFVKFISVRSPNLKRVIFRPSSLMIFDGEVDDR